MELIKDFRGVILAPASVWMQGGFKSNTQIAIDQDGKIAKIGQNLSKNEENIIRLPETAVLPGMINAHSHAFHRGLRYHCKQSKNQNLESNFWSWRDNMYDLALSLTKEQLLGLCQSTFKEMLKAGFTTVGEFHYLHHSTNELVYDLDRIILKAAKHAGIRIVLLETYYEQAGLKDEELHEVQKKFLPLSLEEFWSNFDELAELVDKDPLQSLGIAAHSVRAVRPDNIAALSTEAQRRNLPFHIHLEEQQKEIDDCLDTYKVTPMKLLEQTKVAFDKNFTAVHCTHSRLEDMEKVLEKGGNVCICPLTEGRLGDGIPMWLQKLDVQKYSCSVGSDCNFRICPFEELRWLLYTQQMVTNKRGFASAPPINCAQLLYQFATAGGARALNLPQTGSISEGNWADLVFLDLAAPVLQECKMDNLMETAIFGTAVQEVVTGTVVGGILHDWRSSKAEAVSTSAEVGGNVSESRKFIIETEIDTAEKLTEALMAIESTSGNEGNVARALGNWLKKKGWNILLQPLESNSNRLNLLATRNPQVPPKVIFNSHMDTVPPYIPPNWSPNGDTLYGRGSCDAKGVVAAMIFAAHKLIEMKPDRTDIGLLFLVGEETDHIGAKEASKLQLNPDLIICGEPTESRMANGQKGILKVEVSCTGQPAHSGYPHKGFSAIHLLLDFLSKVRNYPDWPSDKLLGATTLNIGTISGGEAANVLAAKAEAVIAFRTVSDPQILLDAMNTFRTGDKNIELMVITSNGPLKLHTRGDFETATVAFNTDLPYIQFGNRPKMVLFGPGSITVAHSAGEFIDVRELNAAIDKYVSIVNDWKMLEIGS